MCYVLQIHQRWKLHKPLVAVYWFINLDNSKQTKVKCYQFNVN